MTDSRTAPRHPLVELTLARFREFLREPEAVFWVFAFPIIMTCALGIAFRSRGAEPVIVGVADRPARTRSSRRSSEPAASPCAGSRRTDVERGAARRPRAGRRRAGHAADVSLRRGARGEPGRAARRRRTRCSARPAAPTRSRRVEQPVRDRRLALHRLARARPARHEHHGHRHVGRRLRDRPGADAQAAEAAGRHADARVALPAVARAAAGWCSSRSRSSCSSASAWLAFGVPSTARSAALAVRRARSARWRSAASACWSPAARGRSKRCRA